MNALRYWTILAAVPCVMACTPLVETGKNIESKTRKAMFDATETMQELIRYHPTASIKQAPQTAFCYKTVSDIICYDSPKPYISNRLTGYQGYTAAVTPSTIMYAPENAHYEGPIRPKTDPHDQILIQANAPLEAKPQVVVHGASAPVLSGAPVMPPVPQAMPAESPAEKPAVGQAEPGKATQSPQGLMPRF